MGRSRSSRSLEQSESDAGRTAGRHGREGHALRAEAADFERTSLERLLTTFAREVPISGELNEIWLETAKGRVPPGRSTSLVVDPPDGIIPDTPEGRKRWDTVPKVGQTMRANVPEDRTEAERCITTDGLLIPNPFYNNYFQIVQAPGHVAIVTEMMHEPRVIPVDPRAGRRPHAGSGVRMWPGRFTRVVGRPDLGRGNHELQRQAAVPRSDRRSCISSSDSPGSMPTRFDYRLTVTDPATFARPWTIVNGLRRSDSGIYEVACHEGNIGLRGILAGARAQEAR